MKKAKAVRTNAENLKVGDILNGQRIHAVITGKGRKGTTVGVVLKHPKNRVFEIKNLHGLVCVNRPKKNFSKKVK